MCGIGIGGKTYNLTVNLCTACFSMLILFKYHGTGTFTDNQTVSILIKRSWGKLWSIVF